MRQNICRWDDMSHQKRSEITSGLPEGQQKLGGVHRGYGAVRAALPSSIILQSRSFRSLLRRLGYDMEVAEVLERRTPEESMKGLASHFDQHVVWR